MFGKIPFSDVITKRSIIVNGDIFSIEELGSFPGGAHVSSVGVIPAGHRKQFEQKERKETKSVVLFRLRRNWQTLFFLGSSGNSV
jgi:hypothetical protein